MLFNHLIRMILEMPNEKDIYLIRVCVLDRSFGFIFLNDSFYEIMIFLLSYPSI